MHHFFFLFFSCRLFVLSNDDPVYIADFFLKTGAVERVSLCSNCFVLPYTWPNFCFSFCCSKWSTFYVNPTTVVYCFKPKLKSIVNSGLKEILYFKIKANLCWRLSQTEYRFSLRLLSFAVFFVFCFQNHQDNVLIPLLIWSRICVEANVFFSKNYLYIMVWLDSSKYLSY